MNFTQKATFLKGTILTYELKMYTYVYNTY